MKRKTKQKIGQAILYLSFNIGLSVFMYWAFLQNTIY